MKENETIWMSSLLPERHPEFFRRLLKKLVGNKINFQLLNGTKDIWVRDFLPVSDGVGGFVQFRFNPGYLKSSKYGHLLSNPVLLWDQLGINPVCSDLVIDGGNIVRNEDTVITTDFIRKNNPDWPEEELIKELQFKLKIDRVIIIPHLPGDFTGHADGMVKFARSGKLLINDFAYENIRFRNKLHSVLKGSGIEPINFVFSPVHSGKDLDSARGTYINFLDTGKTILFPIFGLKDDQKAIAQVSQYYPNHKIIKIDSNEIVAEGGILNCISWTG